MRTYVIRKVTLWALVAVQIVCAKPEDHPLLDGIENIANTASNLLTGLVQRQKELIHRVTDTATEYISSAVERPKNLLIDATRVTTGYIDSAASKSLEFKLRRFLEKFRGWMPYGVPELGIPPLEPLHLDEVDMRISNPEIGNVSAAIEDLNVSNLSTFVINKAKLSLIGPTLTANISVPRIHVEGLYNISGKLGFLIPLDDAGPFKANISDFQVYVHAVLGYSRGLYLKIFDIDFSVKSVDMVLENFRHDEEISAVISKVFQELTPKALEIIKPDILPTIRSNIGGQINDTLQHLSMRSIINALLDRNEIAQLIIP